MRLVMNGSLPPRQVALFGFIGGLLLAACSAIPGGRTLIVSEVDEGPESVQVPNGIASTRIPESKYDDYEIVTLLPRDAIPAIDKPRFLEADEADSFYDPTELVIGVDFNDDARAYSVPFLSGHEIVNDTVGGVKIAVTW